MVRKAASRKQPASPFVGREADLEHFRRLFEAAAGGRGAVVVITGDHGVGKTRLAREAGALARQAGATVLWGRGYDDEGSPAYWPWAEVVRRSIDHFGLRPARRLMGAGVRDIAGLIPALEQLAPAGAGSREPPSREARYRLFAAMRSFVERAAAEAPLLLVFDDLHYCDPDTLRLFEAVAEDVERGPVVLVGTYVQRRATRHPVLPSVIGALSRLPWYHEVPVSNLTEPDVRLLLEPEVGKKESAALAASVLRRTDGNALYVVEAVRHIAAGAAAGERPLTDDRWEEGAAAGVAMLINRRLGGLADRELAAVRAAAVVGRELDVAVVAATVGVEPSEARALLAASVDEGLIAETGADRYRFSHELLQRAVAAGLPTVARTALHLAAGEALERLRARGRAVDPGRLAWHFSRAGGEHARKAAGYAREAGERALEAAAYDTALRHLDDSATDSSLAVGERADIDLLRAQTLFALGRFIDAADQLSATFEMCRAAGDTARAVRAAEFTWFPEGELMLPPAVMRKLRERALAMVAPGSEQAARLLVRLGVSYSWNRHEKAEECLMRAFALARERGDRALEARVHYGRARLAWTRMRHPEEVEHATRALRIARELRDRSLELVIAGRVGLFQLFAGEPQDAIRTLRATVGSVDELAPTMWNSNLVILKRLILLWTGQWEGLRQEFERPQWLRRLQPVAIERGRSGARLHLGDPAGHLSHMNENPQYFADPDSVASRVLSAADFSRALGDHAQLDRIMELARRALALELSPRGRVHALAALGYAAFMKGNDEAIASVWCAELTEPPNFMMEGLGLDRLRGLFAARLGRIGEARAYFEAALAFARGFPSVWEIPCTCLDYAIFLLQQGEVSLARGLAEEARRAGTGIGMPGFEREVADLLARIEGALPDGLTEREVEVLRLVAAGLPTKQVADRLAISYHTAVNHLRHIYAKTGARGRVELAGYAARRRISLSDSPR